MIYEEHLHDTEEQERLRDYNIQEIKAAGFDEFPRGGHMSLSASFFRRPSRRLLRQRKAPTFITINFVHRPQMLQQQDKICYIKPKRSITLAEFV